MLSNSTSIDDYSDHFPLSYEEEDLTNGTYYDDYIFNNNQTFNLTNFDVLSFSSIFSFSTPFSYIFLILMVYLVLTMILLSFSLYKQRQSEIDQFSLGDTEEDIEQTKRSLIWKQFLIGKIRKGDMEPLLIEIDSYSINENDSQSKTVTFPIHIV